MYISSVDAIREADLQDCPGLAWRANRFHVHYVRCRSALPWL